VRDLAGQVSHPLSSLGEWTHRLTLFPNIGPESSVGSRGTSRDHLKRVTPYRTCSREMLDRVNGFCHRRVPYLPVVPVPYQRSAFVPIHQRSRLDGALEVHLIHCSNFPRAKEPHFEVRRFDSACSDPKLGNCPVETSARALCLSHEVISSLARAATVERFLILRQ
jgi:hypothetical protein